LISASPPERIASATAEVGASRIACQSPKRAQRLANARSVFTSEVFCERIVWTSSASAPSVPRGSGAP
jgi:hypothetical protein